MRISLLRTAVSGLAVCVAGISAVQAEDPAAEQKHIAAATAAAKMRQLVTARKLFPTPVIHDALSAKLSEHHGFQCVFAGGLPIAYTM